MQRQAQAIPPKRPDVDKLIERKVSTILSKLSSYPNCILDSILKGLDGDVLLVCLKHIEKFLRRHTSDKKLFSENLFIFMIKLLDINRLSKRHESFGPVYEILTLFCPNYICHLKYLGFENHLDVILKDRLKERLISFEENAEIKLVYLTSQLFPPLPNSRCYKDVDKNFENILFVGEKLTSPVRFLFTDPLKNICSTVFNICLSDSYSSHYSVLLLKVVYWSKRSTLYKTVRTCELLRLIKALLENGCKKKLITGLAFVTTLIQTLASRNTHKTKTRLILGNVRANVSDLLKRFSSGKQWIANLYSFFDPTDPVRDECRIIKSFLGLGVQRSTYLRMEAIRSMLEFVMPFHLTDGQFSTLYYSRLRTFVEIVLNLPRDAAWSGNKLTFELQGMRAFKTLVCLVRKTVEKLHNLDVDFEEFVESLPDSNNNRQLSRQPSSSREVDLGLFKSEAFDECLRSAANLSEEMRESDIFQSMKMLEILHAVNENWGSLFCTLSTEILINRNLFVSSVFQKKLSNALVDPLGFCPGKYPVLYKYAQHYPFLLDYNIREDLFYAVKKGQYKQYDDPREFEFVVPRGAVVEHVADNMDRFRRINTKWNFEFSNEMGHGFGPTKEFYTEFSRSSQRHDLGLWIGEASLASDGIEYTRSTCGLFPSPVAGSGSMKLYSAIARITTKSLLEELSMDFDFSPAFYKGLLGPPDSQSLALVDLKYVVPAVFNFAVDLVESLRQKKSFERDETMTRDEKEAAIARITCAGASFEDLCINFTLPGFPNKEMKRGGRDIYLSIGNLEEYLRLLVWHFLYKGCEECFRVFRRQLYDVFEASIFRIFYPRELENLFCGIKNEAWSVEYLESQFCLTDDLSTETPVVQYLFEVLSSLNAVEQGRFLMFVTSSPRLPVGGLSSLDPPMTVGLVKSTSDRDLRLPSSMTCTNTLFIPMYSCKQVLKEKLLTAITEGPDFQFI